MKVPLSLLKKFIKLSFPPSEISKVLTMAGLEVDAIETVSPEFNGIIVGQVTKTEKHPNADKLCVATVSDGKESYQVVCGAPNCREGLKTAFAKVGSSLKDEEGKDFFIKNAKLRGVESSGMLCSTRELNLGEEHEGIIEFSEDMQVGTDLRDFYSETVFDISLTPNLGHCASVWGVARELSAATGEPVHLPQIAFEEKGSPINSSAKVKVEDKKKCPRYACRIIKNVKVGPSPDWLKNYLASFGIRSVNNVVDVTNYVLMELGHPLHAFDYDLLDGSEVIVRSAQEGELFTTLDNKERVLNKDDLLICDKSKGIALAGIMGGLNTEVGLETKNILIESAYFHPGTIRRTSKRLGLQTDASKRFERGTDPHNVLRSLERAVMLIQQVAGGEITQGTIDIKEDNFPEKVVTCRLSRANKILGTHLGVSEAETIFKRLGMHYQWDGQDLFTVKVPTYRADVRVEIDLIEELARIYGFENISTSQNTYHSSTLAPAPIFLFEREVRGRLIAEGLQEFLTCDLIGPEMNQLVQLPTMPEDSIIKVMNPTSIDQSILRTSLLPGMLQLLQYNIDHQNSNVCGFEIGRIHFKEKDQFKEQSAAGILLYGNYVPHSWAEKSKPADFYDLKGILENVLHELCIPNITFKENNLSIFHMGRQASIFSDSLEIGSLGEIHPSIQRILGIPQRILFAEINLHDLFQVRKKECKFQEIPIYPCSDRDWTITMPKEMEIQKVIDVILSIPSCLLEEVTLLDIYHSDKLGKNLKNATFHFVYRDFQKTIAQEDVDAEHARILSESEKIIKI